MFTAPHFIWLGALALLIAIALVTVKRLGVSHIAVQRVVTVLLIAFKLFHVSLSMKPSADGGYILDQNQLSFHLCSIMIYAVVLINIIKNEKFVSTAKSFMVPCMLIGAAMALLIPTAGVDPLTPRVWEYMITHSILVFYGLYLMVIEKVDLSLKAYLTNLKLLSAVVLLGFLMNSILEPYNTNYLFLRKPPMDNLPVLNLDNGWFVYFLVLASVACTLLLLVHLPFILKGRKAKKK